MNNKICVIGAGWWGKNHIRTLDELGLLSGIVEPNKNNYEYFSSLYPDISIYPKLNHAIDSNIHDAFIVSTPADTHYKIANTVIKAGKHVLIEKPLVLNIDEAEHLLSLVKKYKVTLMVGHVLLFHPAIKKIKELIDNGKIGKLQYIYSNRLNLGQIRTQENVFWSLAPHDIAIFQFLTNSFPIYIQANGASFIQKGIHDSTITQLKYPDGIEGHIFVSWLHPFKEHRIVVIGSEAMLVFNDSTNDSSLKLYSKKINMSSGVPEKIDGPVEDVPYENKMPLTEELSYFNMHLNGKSPDIANINHAIEVTKILVEASKKLDL